VLSHAGPVPGCVGSLAPDGGYSGYGMGGYGGYGMGGYGGYGMGRYGGYGMGPLRLWHAA